MMTMISMSPEMFPKLSLWPIRKVQKRPVTHLHLIINSYLCEGSQMDAVEEKYKTTRPRQIQNSTHRNAIPPVNTNQPTFCTKHIFCQAKLHKTLPKKSVTKKLQPVWLWALDWKTWFVVISSSRALEKYKEQAKLQNRISFLFDSTHTFLLSFRCVSFNNSIMTRTMIQRQKLERALWHCHHH